MTAVVKSAKAMSDLPASGPTYGLTPTTKQQRRANHNHDADAGKRTVRRTDESRHVTAHRRDKETHQDYVGDTADDRVWEMRAETALVRKNPSSQPIGSMQTSVTKPTMPIGISRSVIGSVSAFPALRARDRRHRASQSARDRLDQFQQCPDGRNADRTRANKAQLMCSTYFVRVSLRQS